MHPWITDLESNRMSIIDSLRDKVPAIFAEQPSPVVSPSYKFFSTLEILQGLENNGWSVQTATQVRTRDPGRKPFAKHLISLVHNDLPFQKKELGNVRPTLNLVNSHNHTSKLLGVLGLFRLVCLNGAMVCVGEVFGISLRHDTDANIPELTGRFVDQGRNLIETADRWASVQLSDDQRLELAVAARTIRFGEDSNIDPRGLLVPRRSFDDKSDLWTTFNVLQENIMQGGIRFNGMRRQSRAITNIDKNVGTNLGLWQAAEKFALPG